MTLLHLNPQMLICQEPPGTLVDISHEVPAAKTSGFAAIVTPESEGGYSVIAAHYPGVISQGETLDEALENIADAFLAMKEACEATGDKMPFSVENTAEMTSAARQFWVTVDG